MSRHVDISLTPFTKIRALPSQQPFCREKMLSFFLPLHSHPSPLSLQVVLKQGPLTPLSSPDFGQTQEEVRCFFSWPGWLWATAQPLFNTGSVFRPVPIIG